ncbi:MAG TPA: DUF6328 family protein [Jatrophihabitans sp.]|jgi:hypothetical protein
MTENQPPDEKDPSGVQRDAGWNREVRGETTTERLDRNWSDLLQELRVVQTGVQVLTGFLLTLPFQARFGQLTGSQQLIYLVTVCCSTAATVFLIAPVGVHRLLFRRHARGELVAVGHRLTLAGLFLLGCAVVGVVLMVFDVVRGRTVAVVAAGITAAMIIALWTVLPWYLRNAADKPSDDGRERSR